MGIGQRFVPSPQKAGNVSIYSEQALVNAPAPLQSTEAVLAEKHHHPIEAYALAPTRAKSLT